MPPRNSLDAFTDIELAAGIVFLARSLIESGELTAENRARHLAAIEAAESRYSPDALKEAWEGSLPKLIEFGHLTEEHDL